MTFKPYPKYKASGVEWLGDVPEEWIVKKLKHNFACLDGKRVPLSGEERSIKQGIFPYYGASGVIDHIDEYIFDEALILVSEDGANLLNRVTPIAFVARGKYWVNNHAHILRPHDKLVGYWSDRIENEDVTPFVTGSAQPKLTLDALANIYLTAPSSIADRLEISEFIARLTPSIDNLIAKQELLIEVLKEKRQAVILHAVTKGLDSTAQMKRSGVDLFGDVPKHWKIKKVKFLSNNIKAGPFGSAITKDMYCSEGYRVYGQEQVIPDDFSIGDYFINEENFESLRQYEVLPGDILISCVGTFGRIAVAPDSLIRGIINPRLIRLRSNKSVSSIFLATVLRSSVGFEQFALLSRGGTMDIINIGVLSELLVALPPLEEQNAIITGLDKKLAKIDTLIAKAQEAINLQKEHRTALISAAVTGKIDVRGVISEKQAA